MPPVLGPASSSSSRLWSWLDARGRMFRPSTITMKLASSPSRKSSITTLAPAWPMPPSVSIMSTAACAWSRSVATTTPLPAASPSALITMGAPRASMYACAAAASEKVSYSAVGMPWRFMKALAKSFDDSSWAAARVGPKIFRPRARKMSTMPAASGASGPTTVNATCSRSASAARVCGSLTGMLRTPGSRAVPPLPGATMTCWTLGERARHQASACSRPPEPTTRIFMRVPSFGFLVLEHGVRVHLLGVVELLEGVDQLLDALAVLGVQLDLDVGTHRDLGDLGLEPGRLEAALEGPEIGRR